MGKPKTIPKPDYRKLYLETIKVLSYPGLSDKIRKEVEAKQAKYYELSYGQRK